MSRQIGSVCLGFGPKKLAIERWFSDGFLDLYVDISSLLYVLVWEFFPRKKISIALVKMNPGVSIVDLYLDASVNSALSRTEEMS